MNILERIRSHISRPDSSGEFREEATFLLNHPVMLEAFDRLENDLLVQFLHTKPSDVEAREEIHYQLSAFQSLKARLESFIYASLINRSNND